MNETELNQFTLSIECLKLALRLSHAINNETIDLNILKKDIGLTIQMAR
jgi:hypothetical protein